MVMTFDTDLTARRRLLLADLADVRAGLPGLALKAAAGDAEAVLRLEMAEQQAADIGRDLARLTLAAEEASRRADAERRQAEGDRRRQLAATYQSAGLARDQAYTEVELALAGLAGPIGAALAAGSKLDRAANAVGQAPAMLSWAGQTRLALAERVLHVLGGAGLAPVLAGNGRGMSPLADIKIKAGEVQA